MDSLVARLTSRKFLAAVVAGVISVLAAVDVIDPSNGQVLVAQATPLVYILVEGFLDHYEA